MASGATEQGKERVAHPLGQCEASGIELTRFAAEEDIEGAPAPWFGAKSAMSESISAAALYFGNTTFPSTQSSRALAARIRSE